MIVLSEEDKKFIRKNLNDPDRIISSDRVNDVLDAIFDAIEERGFAPPDYYNYNDFGRKAQRVYDNIFTNNATEDELATKLQPIA